MTTSGIKLKFPDFEDTSVNNSFYSDVDIFTDGKTIKGHQLILAKRSPWFDKFFQSQERSSKCAIAFFNFSVNVVKAVVDVVYGKEVVMSSKEKPRLIFLLDKLGISWVESENQLEESVVIQESRPARTKRVDAPVKLGTSDKETSSSQSLIPEKKDSRSESLEAMTKPVNAPGKPVASEKEAKRSILNKAVQSAPMSSTNVNEFFAMLDEFTETNQSELDKIHHMLLGNSGEANRMYKCMKCSERFKFFTQAEKHHREHEFIASKPIRDKLIKAELDRQNEETSLSKLEKAIGKKENKSVIKAIRLINEKLTQHQETLDNLDRSKMNDHMKRKRKEYSDNLTKTTNKVEKMLEKLGAFI